MVTSGNVATLGGGCARCLAALGLAGSGNESRYGDGYGWSGGGVTTRGGKSRDEEGEDG
jgi:hypothetical protein